MNQPSHKYNPGFHDDTQLTRAFVVRQRELDLILDTIRENTGSANQHLLVVGPRGSGKTMLVHRVAAAVRADPGFDAQWYPLLFPEEAYEVLSAGELWLETLFHLGEQTGDERWSRTYEELKKEPDDDRLRDRALAQLLDFADERKRRILLVVENLNMLLGEQLGNQNDWDLRHTLLNEPRLMLLATATVRFEEIDRIDKAWFELFSVHDLEPLNLESCRTLWQSITGEEAPLNRLRPIEILTGGNPRLLRILAEFAARRSFRDLMDNLILLIDDHTDYFKSHLDSLAPAERKVFVSLLEMWDPVTAQDVARAARMDVSKTSALLHRLLQRGALTTAAVDGRKKWYQAAERLYNIYYLMRRRGDPSTRIRAIVAFITQFYEGEELVRSTVELASEARRLNPESRKDLYRTYRGIVDSTPHQELRTRAPDLPDQVRELVHSVPFEEGDSIRGVTDLLISAAAAGYAKQALKLIAESEAGPRLEPLEVGLRLFLGEEPRVAQEILEVGKDVAARIREEQRRISEEEEI